MGLFKRKKKNVFPAPASPPPAGIMAGTGNPPSEKPPEGVALPETNGGLGILNK